jgi:hypothetical protein
LQLVLPGVLKNCIVDFTGRQHIMRFYLATQSSPAGRNTTELITSR